MQRTVEDAWGWSWVLGHIPHMISCHLISGGGVVWMLTQVFLGKVEFFANCPWKTLNDAERSALHLPATVPVATDGEQRSFVLTPFFSSFISHVLCLPCHALNGLGPCYPVECISTSNGPPVPPASPQSLRLWVDTQGRPRSHQLETGLLSGSHHAMEFSPGGGGGASSDKSPPSSALGSQSKHGFLFRLSKTLLLFDLTSKLLSYREPYVYCLINTTVATIMCALVDAF